MIKSILCTLCVLLLTGAGLAAQEPDLSSPEATVRSFFAAFNRGDIKQILACVVGAKSSAFSDYLEQQIRQHPVTLTPNNVKVETTGYTATVTMTVTRARKGQADDTVRTQEWLSLQREEAGWKIVPLNFTLYWTNQMAVLSLATALADQGVGGVALEKARAVSCLSNAKQISTAAVMFLQDHGNRFALSASTYKKSLTPYLVHQKSPTPQILRNVERIFRCPEDKSGKVSYSFNRNLAGVLLAKIKRPAETVMIYEGVGQQLTFRHNGKAVVGFADGHVKLIPREEAKTLRWTP